MAGAFISSSVPEFLQKTKLGQLITESDLKKLLAGKACFAPETILSVYALLPVKLQFKDVEIASKIQPNIKFIASPSHK